MKKSILIIIVILVVIAVGIICYLSFSKNQQGEQNNSGNSYESITQEEAKKIMDNESNIVILDVRTQEEYNEGHIKNATLIPLAEIEGRAENELKDKSQIILVYCRSGNRSKQASQILADKGYTNIKEFGGITSWQYGTTTE